MKIPWRFILGLGMGLILAVVLFTHALYSRLGVSTEFSAWIHDIIQKKETLAARIPGPRLFLVAGSSTLFGLNAQLIEEKTGCPTINFGIHAGLGLPYMLRLTEENVRPGDTVLLAFEYEFYANAETKTEQYDDYILACDPDLFRHLSIFEKIDMATRIPYKRIQGDLVPLDKILPGSLGKYFKPKAKAPSTRAPNLPYAPFSSGYDCLDDHGDEIYNMQATRPSVAPTREIVIGVLRDGPAPWKMDGFPIIADFLSWAKSHQVTVLATFPNVIYRPVYDEPNGQKVIGMIDQFYASHGVPLIGTAKEAMLPEEDFFDTGYHLTHEATLKRTERLIPKLSPYLHPSK